MRGFSPGKAPLGNVVIPSEVAERFSSRAKVHLRAEVAGKASFGGKQGEGSFRGKCVPLFAGLPAVAGRPATQRGISPRSYGSKCIVFVTK
jgi:hypothetical protein